MALLTAAKANLRRLALVRLIVIGGEIAALAYALFALEAELRYGWLLAAILLQVAATAFIFWRLRRAWPVTDGEFFGQLLVDAGSLSLLLYCSGGATNPFVSYYLVPLAIAGAVLPSRYTAGLAAICISAYTALLFFYDPLPLLSPLAGTHHHGDHGTAQSMVNPHVVGMWFNFTLSALLITYVVARMANALRDQYDELNQRREQALHNEQLLAVATLAAGTAHELGTPLTTMKLLLDDMPAADPAQRADIELLKQQVQTCHATLKNLVATAESHQRQQFPLQPVDRFLHAALERWQIIRPSARYRLDLPTDAGAIPALRPDETLQQALLNLLNNGADASVEPLELKLEWDARDIVLRIRDHGAGVPLEIAEQLGKPFVTSKGKGLGLGLFLSHATIERCGGDIHMYNHAGGGTEVVLRLPIEGAGDA
jgi:two-component system sensor histidine kinase RegB